jgi:ectoine hydroxylase-related dioxygenase (phytanoyl-CoA dioxygenase family)
MTIEEQLKEPMSLTTEQIEFYQTNRYIKIKNVLSPEVVNHFNKVVTARVEKMKTETRPLEQRDTYGKAFLQLMNLWMEDEAVKELVFSPRIAKLAADLIKVNGVRLYHDQALYKEAGGGITPWHADQYYWPLSNDNTVTAWIPLQKTPLEMGPLEFSAGSHIIQEGRDLAIGDQSETVISKQLRVTDFTHVVEPFDIGEISFHSGWIFHRAGANQTDLTRKVMTIIYMDKDMRLKAPENDGQQNDWDTWCPGANIDAIINTPLNPVLYPV